MNDILEMLDSGIVLKDDAVNDLYAKDWSETPAHRPAVVLRPRNTADVARIVSLCQKYNQPLVTQGGRTGLSGGATPRSGEWVLSLERLNRILEIDPVAMTITVEAGVVLEIIQNEADKVGLVFPLDLGARGSCTAGGIAATNAGGTQVIQRGMTRALVLGLEAVLPDGCILPARNQLIKNNAGFDLKHLLIGSEGTLGVITELTFRLFPKRPTVHTALCGFRDFDSVTTFLDLAQRKILALSAFEVMWSNYFVAAREITKQRCPLSEDFPFSVLLEAEGLTETDGFETLLAEALECGILDDAVIAQNITERQNLWKIRDGVSELIPALNPMVNFDIGIPIRAMERFTQKATAQLQLRFENCTILIFGHMGDGNLHMFVSTGNRQDEREIEKIVFDLTRKVGGTITAEHGIGMLKRDWLPYSRSNAEINLMRKLKTALDPACILNPDRVISVGS